MSVEIILILLVITMRVLWRRFQSERDSPRRRSGTGKCKKMAIEHLEWQKTKHEWEKEERNGEKRK